MISASSYFPDPLVDVWSRALFVLQDRPRYTLLDLLEQPDCLKAIATAKVAQSSLYKLDIRTPRGTDMEVFIDPKHNFLVKKVVSHSVTRVANAPALRTESEVLSFQQHQPGLFFPREVVMRVSETHGGRDRLIITHRTRFRSVKINEPVDPKIFDLTIPVGADVLDERNDTTYVMGPDGRPADKPVPAPATMSGHTAVVRQSKEKRYAWLGVLSVAFAAMACGAVLWHRSRRRGS